MTFKIKPNHRGGVSINSSKSKITTVMNEGNISTNECNISTNTGNISTNEGNISTNEGNISTNQGNISKNTVNISNNTNLNPMKQIATYVAIAEDVIEELNNLIVKINNNQEDICDNYILNIDDSLSQLNIDDSLSQLRLKVTAMREALPAMAYCVNKNAQDIKNLQEAAE